MIPTELIFLILIASGLLGLVGLWYLWLNPRGNLKNLSTPVKLILSVGLFPIWPLVSGIFGVLVLIMAFQSENTEALTNA